MGINEIDLTIYPYTVGRQDCKILPRSFKSLAEAEAYLANQDKGARENGEFYLDGPDQDDTASSSCATRTSEPKVIVTSPPVTQCGETHSDRTPTSIKSQMTRGAWKREIEELCRAVEGES